jgi:hypothetical protein
VQCQDLMLGLVPLKTRDLNGFRRSSTLIFSLDRPLVCTSSRRWRYLLIVLLGIDVARHSGKQGIAGDRPQNTGIGKVGRRDRQRKSGIARAVSHRDHQAAFWLWTTEIMTCQQTRRHKQDGGNHRHHPNCQHFGQCHNQNDEHQLQHFNAPHSELEGSDVLPSELTIDDSFQSQSQWGPAPLWLWLLFLLTTPEGLPARSRASSSGERVSIGSLWSHPTPANPALW